MEDIKEKFKHLRCDFLELFKIKQDEIEYEASLTLGNLVVIPLTDMIESSQLR